MNITRIKLRERLTEALLTMVATGKYHYGFGVSTLTLTAETEMASLDTIFRVSLVDGRTDETLRAQRVCHLPKPELALEALADALAEGLLSN